MAAHNLATLAREHDAFIASVKAAGKRTLTFESPCCGRKIETPAAPKGKWWDTLAVCQHCGATYLKLTGPKRALGCVPVTSGMQAH